MLEAPGVRTKQTLGDADSSWQYFCSVGTNSGPLFSPSSVTTMICSAYCLRRIIISSETPRLVPPPAVMPASARSQAAMSSVLGAVTG